MRRIPKIWIAGCPLNSSWAQSYIIFCDLPLYFLWNLEKSYCNYIINTQCITIGFLAFHEKFRRFVTKNVVTLGSGSWFQPPSISRKTTISGGNRSLLFFWPPSLLVLQRTAQGGLVHQNLACVITIDRYFPRRQLFGHSQHEITVHVEPLVAHEPQNRLRSPSNGCQHSSFVLCSNVVESTKFRSESHVCSLCLSVLASLLWTWA